MSWLGRVFGGKKLAAQGDTPAIDTDVSCSFCGKHRREVRKLIAGPKVHICDECIALCIEIMQTETRAEGGDYNIASLLVDVERQGARARHEDVRPSLKAALELARGDADVLRRVTSAAAKVSDPTTALAAIDAMAGGDRGPHDHLNQVAMLVELGRGSEAKAVLDALTPPVDVTAVLRARIYRAWVELELGSATRPQLAVHLQTARELGASVAVLADSPMKDLLRVGRYRILTAAALALGELHAAEEAVEAWVLLSLESAEAHVALADVRRARGDADAAARATKRARELVHPDSPLARRLATASESPFR